MYQKLASQGLAVHGEADLTCELVPPGSRVLDAGCGTGRVAIELHRRGYLTLGVDLDESMLGQARLAAPGLAWLLADLATLDLAAHVTPAGFDLALLAGNVMVNLAPGTEASVIAHLAATVRARGLVVAGFRLDRQLSAGTYTAECASAGLTEMHRWGDWQRGPYTGTGFAVMVHQRAA